MNNIVKICSIHGELTKEQVFFRKPPRNEKVCKICNNIKSAKHRYKKDIACLTERKCSKCRVIKSKEFFKPYDWKLTSPYCAICRKTHSTKDYHKNRSHLKTRFGITIEEYNLMFLQQNNCCAICYKESKSKRLAVDHCHITGKIRGLLCSKCNQGIGLFYENIESLKRAILYLETNPALNQQPHQLL